jgi:hypothetical protein
VLLILSEHSINSDWVEDEVTAGFEEERNRGERHEARRSRPFDCIAGGAVRESFGLTGVPTSDSCASKDAPAAFLPAFTNTPNQSLGLAGLDHRAGLGS